MTWDILDELFDNVEALCEDTGQSAILLDDLRSVIVEVRRTYAPPVEYPKGYDHRRGCSRSHPVHFPCDNGTPTAAAIAYRRERRP